jgi:hypothetical protein
MTSLPSHIKSLLSESDISELWERIEYLKMTMANEEPFDETGNDTAVPSGLRLSKIINSNMGKIYFNLPSGFIPDHIQAKIDSAAEGLEAGVKFHSATYTEYSSEYGTPSLSTHQDRFDIFLLLDLQINSNTSWKLSAAGVEYDLSDGDALALHAGSTDHGRPEKVFKDGETVSMIFLDYMRPGAGIDQ